jgi:DNA-binding transcriptional regulator LsrR (DeoR family)
MRAVRVLAPIEGSEDYAVVVEAANLFYLEGLPQSTIAERLEVSQSTVSRLLGGCPRKNPPAFYDHVALEEP